MRSRYCNLAKFATIVLVLLDGASMTRAWGTTTSSAIPTDRRAFVAAGIGSAAVVVGGSVLPTAAWAAAATTAATSSDPDLAMPTAAAAQSYSDAVRTMPCWCNKGEEDWWWWWQCAENKKSPLLDSFADDLQQLPICNIRSAQSGVEKFAAFAEAFFPVKATSIPTRRHFTFVLNRRTCAGVRLMFRLSHCSH